MATTTTSTLDDELLRVYNKEKLFEPCERMQPRAWDEMKEADDIWPGGVGVYFRIIGNMGHAQSNPGETGDWSTARVRNEVQCYVTSAQIDSPIELSAKFFEAAQGEGSFAGDPEHEAVVEATKGLYAYADKLIGCGHGTGRLAIVNATTVGSTTWVAKQPEGAHQLREGEPLDFVNTDTGGTVQSSGVIARVDYRTSTVTMTAALSLTANWGAYRADAYGNPIPNGFRNIIDDGDFGTSIFGQSRTTSTNNFLNATVQDGSGGLQDYTEELVADMLDLVTGRQDFVPTQLRCNVGIVREHMRVVVPDRVYMVTGASNPDYPSGINQEKLSFQYADTKIPFKVDRNLPGRELYAIHMPSMRKHTLKAADWMRAKGTNQIFHVMPATGGDTYTFKFGANMYMDMNISSRKLNANGKLSNIRDRGTARDT